MIHICNCEVDSAPPSALGFSSAPLLSHILPSPLIHNPSVCSPSLPSTRTCVRSRLIAALQAAFSCQAKQTSLVGMHLHRQRVYIYKIACFIELITTRMYTSQHCMLHRVDHNISPGGNQEGQPDACFDGLVHMHSSFDSHTCMILVASFTLRHALGACSHKLQLLRRGGNLCQRSEKGHHVVTLGDHRDQLSVTLSPAPRLGATEDSLQLLPQSRLLRQADEQQRRTQREGEAGRDWLSQTGVSRLGVFSSEGLRNN